MKALTRLRPEPFEILAVVSLVAAIATLRMAGLRVTFRTFEFMVREMGPRFFLVLVVGVALNLLYRLRPGGTFLSYLRTIRTPSWLLSTLRTWVVCILLAYAYTWLKVSIPLLNGSNWDAALARFDQTLHAGFSPSRFLVALFEGTPLLRFIDWAYALWLPMTMAAFGFFATFPGPRVRAQFLFSHVALWTLGVWLYIAMPAAGPGLAYPGEWISVHAELPRAVETQATLMRNYRKVVESRDTGVLRAGFNPSLGIAAMPSLHVAVDWLLLLWCFRRARPLAGLFIAAVILTFLGSIATGWHYAVDGYVGVAVAQLAFWASQRVSLDLPDLEGPALPVSG